MQSNRQSLFKAIVRDHFFLKFRPYGQPGPLPIGGMVAALLIERYAQFSRVGYFITETCAGTLVNRSIGVVKVELLYRL